MTYLEQNGEIPVAARIDVLVVGGGPGGLSAAVAAARAGVDTMLIERFGFFGGNITATGVESFAWYRHKDTYDSRGIGTELEMLAVELGDVYPEPQSDSYALNTELFKVTADRIVLSSGVKPLLHSFAVKPIMEHNKICGVIIESKSGREAVLAKVVIDATGDADIAYRSGAPCDIRPLDQRLAVTTVFNCSGINKYEFMEHIRQNSATYGDWGGDWAKNTPEIEQRMFSPYFGKEFTKAQEEGLIPRTSWYFVGSWSTISDDGQGTYFNLVHKPGVDCTNTLDLTKAEMEGREQVLHLIKAMRENIPGFQKARLRNFGTSIGTRDSRKIVGEYSLTREDVSGEARFEDSIGIFPEFIDGFGVLKLPITGRFFQLPLRSLIPKKIDNLLVCGRAIAGDKVSHAAVRNMMCCTVTGQGAGIAAATAVKGGTTCRLFDIQKIKEELSRQNVRV